MSFGIKKNRESIILEYGAYHGREPTYKNYIHYVYGEEKGGLRFSKCLLMITIIKFIMVKKELVLWLIFLLKKK